MDIRWSSTTVRVSSRGPRPNLWSRDQAREYSATSGLKALEAWGHERLDAGESVDAVLTDVLGPPGSCAAYLLVGIDLLISHFPKTRDALVPFLASPDLLAFERCRGGFEHMDSGGCLAIGDGSRHPAR